ncbi:MAG: Uma2 family endonuclease [Gemmatimonadota bacterium]|nr:MAG: Uma2 family endonuclease [Gemmatimonadota bacterium]
MKSMTATDKLMTADELAATSIPDKQVELVRGRLLVREPPGTRHGAVSANLAFELGAFVRKEDLGQVFAQDTGFKIASDPDTVRGPDVAFVARERLDRIPDRGYAELAPDLVVEFLSPDDRPGDVLAKIGEYLAAGTRTAWLIDPRRREARVFRADGSVSVIGEDTALDGEDVLPGFSCPLRAILL